MQCPKCGTENPDNVEICFSCNCDLSLGPIEKTTQKAKISKMAILSAVLVGLAGALSIFVSPSLAFYIALFGIFTAIDCIVVIKKTKKKLIGKSLAIAVIIVGTIQVILLSYWRIDATPIPNDYTISDIKSAASKYNKSFELLQSLTDVNGLPKGAVIGLSENEIDKVKALSEVIQKEGYNKICAELESNRDEILQIWHNAFKSRKVLDQLSTFPEIADLTEPNIKSASLSFKNNNIIHLATLYKIYICLQSYQEDENIAVNELLKLDNIIRKLDLNARSFLAKLTCIACFATNIYTANFIINNPQTSQDSLVLLSGHFTQLTKKQLSLKNSLIFEYLMFKNELGKILNEPELKNASFSPLKFNSSLRLYKNSYDRKIKLEENQDEIKELTVWPAIYPKLPVKFDSDGNIPWYYKVYNPIGSSLIRIMIPASERTCELKTRLEIHYDLLQILLNKRLGKEINLKARAYSDEYIIDVEKEKIFSPGPDGIPYTKDDIPLPINPKALGL